MFLKILMGGWDLIKRPNPYSGGCLGVTKKLVNKSYAASGRTNVDTFLQT